MWLALVRGFSQGFEPERAYSGHIACKWGTDCRDSKFGHLDDICPRSQERTPFHFRYRPLHTAGRVQQKSSDNISAQDAQFHRTAQVSNFQFVASNAR